MNLYIRISRNTAMVRGIWMGMISFISVIYFSGMAENMKSNLTARDIQSVKIKIIISRSMTTTLRRSIFRIWYIFAFSEGALRQSMGGRRRCRRPGPGDNITHLNIAYTLPFCQRQSVGSPSSPLPGGCAVTGRR